MKKLILMILLCLAPVVGRTETIVLNGGKSVEGEIVKRMEESKTRGAKGDETTYYKDKIKTADGTIVDRTCSVKRSYYSSGELFSESTHVDGKQNGARRVYYQNGQIKKEGEIKDGVPVGVHKTYSEDGGASRFLSTEYIEGDAYYISRCYSADGVLLFETPHRGKNAQGISMTDGVKKEYYENGNLRKEETYKEDKREGAYKEYYENDTLREEGEYKEGKQHGLCKQYYENGNLREEGEYRDGKLYGVSRTYYSNGTLEFERSYEDGEQVGAYRRYDKDGNLIDSEEKEKLRQYYKLRAQKMRKIADVLLVILNIVSSFTLFSLLIWMIFSWKIFIKAGQLGWSSVVPVTNLIIYLKIIGRPEWWLILFFIPFVNVGMIYLLNMDLAKKFKKGVEFGLGLFLLPFIFYPMLAFKDAKYESRESIIDNEEKREGGPASFATKKKSPGVIIFGSLFILVSLFAFKIFRHNLYWFIYGFSSSVVGLMVDCFVVLPIALSCLVIGIGLLKLKEWARKFVLSFCSVVVLFQVHSALSKILHSSTYLAVYEVLFAFYVMIPFGIALFLVCPVYFFTRPKVREQFE
jgi:antitoxin component YwqK of YwqJK toxin-antitoxin module